MNYYLDFARTNQTFREREGDAEEFDAAFGRMALGFSFLEDTARNVIILLSRIEARTGHILTAGMSFRHKLDVLKALVRDRMPATADKDRKAQAAELLVLCQRAEDLRNTYLHSSYTAAVRAKITARSKDGLRVHLEPIDSGLLLDVAQFIVYSGMELESLPLLLDLADSIIGGADFVTYKQGNSEIATFRFGDVG